MATKKKPTTQDDDAVTRAWKEQVKRRKALGSRDLIRVKPETLANIEKLMKLDGIKAKGTLITNLVEAELKRRERRR